MNLGVRKYFNSVISNKNKKRKMDKKLDYNDTIKVCRIEASQS